jgi:mono/diheme cytochrome c family protein
MKRVLWPFGVTGVLLLSLSAASTGGWATITVEDLPDYLVVQQPVKLTFSIRQHGVELKTGLSPAVEASNGDARLRVAATPAGKPGYYSAAFSPDRAGEWSIGIHSGFLDSRIALSPITATPRGTALLPVSNPERGRRLFVAKGCVTCHSTPTGNLAATQSIARDVTQRQYPAGYLKRFLADPSISPNARGRMPNLNLKEQEIAALASYVGKEKPLAR